jgi:hypothetical protein
MDLLDEVTRGAYQIDLFSADDVASRVNPVIAQRSEQSRHLPEGLERQRRLGEVEAERSPKD